MLPKRLKYYQAYDINFSGMADAYAKNLFINNTGIQQGGCGGSSDCGSVTGSVWGDVGLGLFNLATEATTNILSASMLQKEAERTAAAVQTSANINKITAKQVEVNTLQQTVTDNQKTVNTLTTKLQDATDAPEKIRSIKDQIAQLEDISSNNTDIQAYNQCKADIATVDAYIKEAAQLKTNFDTADNNLKTFCSSTKVQTRGFGENAPITIDVNGNLSRQINQSDYKCKPDSNGNVDQDSQARYDAYYTEDLAAVNKLKADWSIKNQAKIAANDATVAHSNKLSGLPGTGDNAEAKKAGLEEKLQSLGAVSVGSDGGTVGSHNEKLEALKDELAQLEELASSKDSIAAELETAKGTLTENTRALNKANDELNSLKSQFAELGTGAQKVISAKDNIKTQREEYNEARQYDQDGNKRGWFKKLFGLDKSDAQIAEKAELRQAKKDYRAANNAYTQMYGMDATDPQYRQQLIDLGLMPKDS